MLTFYVRYSTKREEHDKLHGTNIRITDWRRKAMVSGGTNRFVSESYTDEHATIYARRYDEGMRNAKISIVGKHITDIEGKRVLDIGAGIGYFSNLCYESGAKAIATDHAVSMVNRIRSRYENKFSIACCKAHLLPFGGDIFDMVLALDVVEHLYEVQQTFSEIKRVMKKGGILIITTDNPDFSVGVFHFSVARKLLNFMPAGMRDVIRNWYQRRLGKCSRYSTPQSTHVEYYSQPRLVELMQYAGFQLTYFDTFPNRSTYGIYGELVERTLTGPMKRYKWSSALYVFRAQ